MQNMTAETAVRQNVGNAFRLRLGALSALARDVFSRYKAPSNEAVEALVTAIYAKVLSVEAVYWAATELIQHEKRAYAGEMYARIERDKQARLAVRPTLDTVTTGDDRGAGFSQLYRIADFRALLTKAWGHGGKLLKQCTRKEVEQAWRMREAQARTNTERAAILKALWREMREGETAMATVRRLERSSLWNETLEGETALQTVRRLERQKR